MFFEDSSQAGSGANCAYLSCLKLRTVRMEIILLLVVVVVGLWCCINLIDDFGDKIDRIYGLILLGISDCGLGKKKNYLKCETENTL